MPDPEESREQKDTLGNSSHYNGTAGTSLIAVPAVSGLAISEFLVECMDTNIPTKKLLVSLDSGVTFKTMSPGDVWQWSPKGNKTQIHIKGNISGVIYESILNTEPY